MSDEPPEPPVRLHCAVHPKLKQYLQQFADGDFLPEMKGKSPEEIAALLIARKVDEMRQEGFFLPPPEENERTTLEQQVAEQQERLKKRTRRGSSEPSGGVGGP